MTSPPKYLLVPCIVASMLALVGISSCTFFSKEGWTRTLPFLNASPLPTATPAPPNPVPDETLYEPLFEEPASVAAWARPIAPENSANARFTPDGEYLIYLALHPGTRWTSLYSVPFAGGEPVRLGTATVAEEILYYSVSANSTRIIYYQPFAGGGLYSNTISGTKAILLANQHILEASISPDGQWVVYWAGEENALYSIAAGGGNAVQLGERLPQSESYQITPDSRYVLYLAAKEVGVDAPVELYRVPIQGGAPLQLSQGGQVRAGGKFLVTPDSQSVIFGNLYVVSIQGGTPKQLNLTASQSGAGIPEAQFSDPPQLSPDGRWVVFLAGDRQHGHVALYSAQLPEGPVVQLSGAPADGEHVQSFVISPDSRTVLYRKGQREEDADLPWYRVPISGGVSMALPGWDWLHQSADGRWIVYGVRLEQGGFDLYSIPSEGGTPIRLNTPVPVNSAVAWVTISPDNRYLLYATTEEPGGGMPRFNGFYLVSISGGEAHEITGMDGQSRADGFFFAPDGRTLLASVDYDGDGRIALYAYTLPVLPAPQE